MAIGGAAGGGKSWALRAMAILWCMEIPNLQVALFRRYSPEIASNHLQGNQGLPAMLGDWIADGTVKYNITANSFRFYNGSIITLNHCNQYRDVEKHRGSEFNVLLIDEGTHFTEEMYRFLRSRVRMSNMHEVPEKYKELFPRIVMSCNPSGPGHFHIKSGWVDAAKPEEIWQTKPEDGGFFRGYFPARLEDNKHLDKNYADTLRGLGSKEMVRAFLEGDWNILAGSMFADCFSRDTHVLPHDWMDYNTENKVKIMKVYRAYDHGHTKPFAVLWCATLQEDYVGQWGKKGDEVGQRTFKKDSIIFLNEMYGWTGTPDEGVKWSPHEVAEAIRDKESRFPFPVLPGPADSSIYDSDISVASDMSSLGVNFYPAEKRAGSRIRGWQKMRELLTNSLQKPPEKPGIYVSENCSNLIRTLLLVERDKVRFEDVDTTQEDHLLDAGRYFCLQVPRTLKTKKVIGL
tara:strand:- start:4597 stop:5976 length:1380 start_codon:yes stop_codon:yes gene_type:complete